MAEEIKDEFIHRVGKIGKQWGLGEPAGRVWGILLFNKKPLTQKEIASQCRYSLGLVSPSLTILENLGMISIIMKRGKVKLYGAVASFMESFEKLVRNFMEQDVRPLIFLLESNLEKIKDKEVKARLEFLIKDYKRVNIILNFFSKILSAKKSFSLAKLKKSVGVVK